MPLRRFRTSLVLATSLFSIVFFSIASPAFAAKAPAAAAAAPSADDLIWRGDHATGRALMEDLAKQYAKDKKGKISLQPFSTLSGLDAVAQGSADFAGSARAKYSRRPEEAALNFIPVALDGAVLITHPKNPVSSLTLKQIHDIYYGRITNWKDLGGEDKPINLYAIASPLDGVEYSLRELVFRNGDQRVAAPRLYINTAKLEEAITLDPAGLGLSTMANTYANKGVKMLGVEGVGATTATVADGSYPLYITLYLAERVDSPKQAAIDHFLEFLATPAAKEIARRHQLTPYSDASDVIARNDKRMAFIDEHVGRDATGISAAMAAAGATIAAPTVAAAATPTPVSAPRATLEAKKSIAPTAESTQVARENLAKAEAKKAAAKKVAAKPDAAKKTEVASVPKKKAEPAKATAKAAAAKKDAKIKATAKADAAKPAKPVTFGNVSGGTTGG
ncbi:MAG TPA: substrate-binding domain-containing protein [Dokdonella sp.]